MVKRQLKLVLIGASSLLGKELTEELSNSAFAAAELLLFDAEAVEGQVTTVGDEAAFIQRVDAATFDDADFAFFTGKSDQTLKYWQNARKAGATVIDLTGALLGQPDVMIWSPWLTPLSAATNHGGGRPDLHTTAILSAHPIATALAVIASRLLAKALTVQAFAATVLQPASELGSAGLDELHQQTVSLLSFKDLPQETFDAQVAFNVLTGFGEEAALPLASQSQSIQAQYTALSNGRLPGLSLHLMQVPVFHGYTGSLFVEFSEPATVAQLNEALAGSLVKIADTTELPSNLSAAGHSELFLHAKPAITSSGKETRFWIEFALDNLKSATAGAIECALAMRSLRPQGKIQ